MLLEVKKQGRYYSPRIDRFLVSALYHEAKRRGLPVVSKNSITTETAEAQSVAGSAAGRFRAVFLREASVAKEALPHSWKPRQPSSVCE